MPTNPIDQDYAFFCDEAGISNDRFTVVGGLCLSRNMIGKVQENIAAFRKEHNMTKELKWTKITDQKSIEYQKLVEYFFAMNNINQCHFYSIVFDNQKWRHKQFNNGDSDIGLSKLYYQILLHRFGRTCGRHGSLYVRVDHRNSSTSLHDLRRMLNHASRRDLGIDSDPFKVIESADSKLCDILQLNDVILGAVCAVKNGKHILETTRQSKRAIGAMVLEKSGLPNFDADSPSSQNKFSIWNFLPKK